MSPLQRIAIFLAGTLGATGVAAAAASSHAGAALLSPYALIALTHAPAVLALALASLPPIFSSAMAALMAGSALFCLDLGMRHFLGFSPVPLLAPTGGAIMIAGWLLVVIAGLFGRRS